MRPRQWIPRMSSVERLTTARMSAERIGEHHFDDVFRLNQDPEVAKTWAEPARRRRLASTFAAPSSIGSAMATASGSFAIVSRENSSDAQVFGI